MTEDIIPQLKGLLARWDARESCGVEIDHALRGDAPEYWQPLRALIARVEAAEGAARKLAALQNDDWFDEIAEFLDDYQDAEIIDGVTHPNKALRLLAKLQEVGL